MDVSYARLRDASLEISPVPFSITKSKFRDPSPHFEDVYGFIIFCNKGLIIKFVWTGTHAYLDHLRIPVPTN